MGIGLYPRTRLDADGRKTGCCPTRGTLYCEDLDLDMSRTWVVQLSRTDLGMQPEYGGLLQSLGTGYAGESIADRDLCQGWGSAGCSYGLDMSRESGVLLLRFGCVERWDFAAQSFNLGTC